ncbi:MAG: SCP2 sterol-binding domain-containing protein [Rhodobacteraceae bacterium]|nr:SCP2 sterol-binding domain-containing protein [Paracoccaceae bacterium]
MAATLGKAMQALENAFPDGFDCPVRFEITDLGSLMLDSEGVRQGHEDAVCVMRADSEVFADILSGRADAMKLFFSGRLRIEGEIGAAMRLGRSL